MGRVSSIRRLPRDLKDRLDEGLRSGAVTQAELVAWLNARLAERAAGAVSKSAVNRYALRMAEVGRKLRESREVAEAWIARLGAEPRGDVGRLVIEIVRTLAFDLAAATAEGEEPATAKLLVDLSEAVRNLEQAAARSVDREIRIKRALKEKVGRALDQATAKGPAAVPPEVLRRIREQVYGVFE